MNTIYRDGKVKISVYADHAPVHFHVRTPDGDSAVELATMTELAGHANRKGCRNHKYPVFCGTDGRIASLQIACLAELNGTLCA